LLEFLRRNRVLLTSACCLLVAAAVVVRMGGRSTRAGGRVERAFLEVMAPLGHAVAAVRGVVAGSWRGAVELWRAREENLRLRAEAARLAERLDVLSEVEFENARLRALLDYRSVNPAEVLAAPVIGRDASGRARTLLIGRGEDAGIVKGAAVVVPAGVVGQVFLASAHAARVLLISDHNSGVDALVQRSRARGIVQGTADGGCVLKYVVRTEDVQVGDLVITSGLDGIFPKGLAIGEVTAIDRGGRGLFQHAEIGPRVDFEELEEVLVTRGPVTSTEVPEFLLDPPGPEPD
jgi:rod shape-determining protein MreC